MLESYNLVYNPLKSAKFKSETAQYFDNKPEGDRASIICAYQNRTGSLQIIKIENIPNFFWEKVVFPSEIILFNSVAEAMLKVYSNDNITAVFKDTIFCYKLQLRRS